MRAYRISLLTFVGTVGTLIGLTLVFVICHRDRLPGPRISDSVSFNEKALWLRQALKKNPPVDILVGGSSMGLTNVSDDELAKITRTKNILNLASWALPISTSCRMIEEMFGTLHPRLVIMPVFFNDFNQSALGKFDWKEFRECLFSPHLFLLYLRDMDVIYYARVYSQQNSVQARNGQIFDSLHFDSFGGRTLSATQFDFVSRRWDSYRRDPMEASGLDPQALPDLEKLLAELRQRKIRFLMVVCPMRRVAEAKFAASSDADLWGQVRKTVESGQGRFIHVEGGADFPDSLFADAYHLNEIGARKVADRLAPALDLSSASTKK